MMDSHFSQSAANLEIDQFIVICINSKLYYVCLNLAQRFKYSFQCSKKWSPYAFVTGALI